MGSLSDTFEPKILDAILGTGHTADFPATVYVALFSVTPSDSSFGTELVGGSYGRVAVVNSDANWADAAPNKTNATAIVFPTATANWPTAVAWAILDHATNATAANIIVWGALATAKTVTTGETPQFNAGALVITAD